ncbi:hypothetical protein HG531_004141 [Fusarium graminearum]|nr:hypothetical protein HG531_004141 [Fusarium graminearum]
MNLEPAGAYRRRFGGGSVAEAAARAAALAARAALVEPGGRPLRRPVTGLLGVGDAGAIVSGVNGDVYTRLDVLLAVVEDG